MFGERLLKLRLSRNLKQKDVAEKIGVSERSYCTYENGTRDPSTETVIKMADFFNVSTDYLLGVSNVPSVNREEPNLQGLLAKIFFEISDETRAEFVGLLKKYIDDANITVLEPTDEDKKVAKKLEKKYSKSSTIKMSASDGKTPESVTREKIQKMEDATDNTDNY